jgi:NAD(P)H-flavin reductase
MSTGPHAFATTLATDLDRPFQPLPVRVRSNRREIEGTFTLVMDLPEGMSEFSFLPGQFNMLYLFGVGEVAISISGDPAEKDHIVHTIRQVGTVTRPMCELKRGDWLGLRGPFGNPWPLREAEGRDLIILAGGVGLPPLRPVIYQVLRQRKKYGRVTLLYGSRSPDTLVFTDEIETWRRSGNLDVWVTVDHADSEWLGPVGVVTALLRWTHFDPRTAIAFMCGPEIMMHFGVRELLRQGVAESSIYVSLERNMKCALGVCGHCQLGPSFVCKDGPVLRADRVGPLMALREL